MSVIEIELPTSWANLPALLRGHGVPRFRPLFETLKLQTKCVFVATGMDQTYDWRHLREFCDKALAEQPLMFARFRYDRRLYHTQSSFVGLSFQIEDEVTAGFFALSFWRGQSDEPDELEAA